MRGEKLKRRVTHRIRKEGCSAYCLNEGHAPLLDAGGNKETSPHLLFYPFLYNCVLVILFLLLFIFTSAPLVSSPPLPLRSPSLPILVIVLVIILFSPSFYDQHSPSAPVLPSLRLLFQFFLPSHCLYRYCSILSFVSSSAPPLAAPPPLTPLISRCSFATRTRWWY